VRKPVILPLLAAVFAVTLAADAARADLTAIVPAYFYPSPGSDWLDLNAAAPRIPITAIMNPGSGPGNFQDNNYVNAVNNLRTAGGKVIGYVSTSWGARSAADVKADIDKYVNWYNVDGIFFDEMTNTGTNATLNHYQDLYGYVKNINPAWEVMGNPGTSTTESYLTRPVADSLIVFESFASNYPGYTPSSWNFNHDPSRIGHLVHSEPGEANMLNHLDLAVARNAGQVYVTDDVMNNPWDRLPTYWNAMVDRIEQINAGGIIDPPPPPTGGQTMSNPVANGAILTNTADRSDWAGIHAYNPDGADTPGSPGVVDYQLVQAAHDDDNFFLRAVLNSSAPLGSQHNVFIDADLDRNSGYIGGGGQLGLGAEFLLQGSTLYAFSGASPTAWGWTALGALPANASPNTDIEWSIPRAMLGNPDGFDFTLFGDNTGEDDYFPNLGTDPFRYLVNLLAGDLDGDGFVGIADLNLILGAWNQTVTAGNPLAGDPSGDGFVGIEDLNLVLGNWNAGSPGVPPTASANIPEPAGVMLLGLGAAGLLKRG